MNVLLPDTGKLFCRTCGHMIYGSHPLDDDVTGVLIHLMAGHEIEIRHEA